MKPKSPNGEQDPFGIGIRDFTPMEYIPRLLTKRQEIASRAMLGMLANSNSAHMSVEKITEQAVKVADALLAALK